MAYSQFDLDPDVLDAFPAQELLFLHTEMADSERQMWLGKWADAGGRLFDGRPIALKNDPVWRRISCRGEGDAPYDSIGAVGAADISRREAEELGLIRWDEELDTSAFDIDSPATLKRPFRR